eukprot:TRINITY_DN5279_c0_g3_i3.p1 TRINITY_DN5279_c0_g3~~TRINITY_DN5279_c0_g3_i3.p1  ORF type:complete len:260 (-),score=57.35 TRINITY_DN5279_c0_g3_i3:366-1145(-)
MQKSNQASTTSQNVAQKSKYSSLNLNTTFKPTIARGPTPTQGAFGRMVVLGKGKIPKTANKIAAPLPLNLPSLKSEQGDSVVSLVPASGAGWGNAKREDVPSSASSRAIESGASTETVPTKPEEPKPTTSTPWVAIIRSTEPQSDEKEQKRGSVSQSNKRDEFPSLGKNEPLPNTHSDVGDGRPSRSMDWRSGRSEIDEVTKFPTLDQWLPSKEKENDSRKKEEDRLGRKDYDRWDHDGRSRQETKEPPTKIYRGEDSR